MAHTLIQIQSHLFIISQPKVSFQFSKRVPAWDTSTFHYIYPVLYFETANGILYL